MKRVFAGGPRNTGTVEQAVWNGTACLHHEVQGVVVLLPSRLVGIAVGNHAADDALHGCKEHRPHEYREKKEGVFERVDGQDRGHTAHEQEHRHEDRRRVDIAWRPAIFQSRDGEQTRLDRTAQPVLIVVDKKGRLSCQRSHHLALTWRKAGRSAMGCSRGIVRQAAGAGATSIQRRLHLKALEECLLKRGGRDAIRIDLRILEPWDERPGTAKPVKEADGEQRVGNQRNPRRGKSDRVLPPLDDA